MVNSEMIDDLINNNHASDEQLLDIRDGISLDISEHVDACPQCQQALSDITELGQSVGQALLADIPQADSDAIDRAWQRITQSAGEHKSEVGEQLSSVLKPDVVSASFMAEAANSNRFQWNSLSTAIYTLAVSVLLTGLVGLYNGQQRGNIEQQTQILQASIDELMLNSRGLETVLQQVASQNNDLTSRERRMADRLYWRLSYLDQMISEKSGTNRPDSDRMKALWGDRIDALTELNHLYSNEQQVVLGIPEI